MDFNKIRKTCKPVRIVIGLALIATAIISGKHIFYLGVIPLIAGLVNFCPLCIVTQKCDLPQNGEKNESN